MEAVPPPEPPPLPARPFNLAVIAWVAIGVYALACVVLYLLHVGGTTLTPYQTGYAVGSMIARVLLGCALPVGGAWLAWRLTRRSVAAANATFFVLLGLLVAVQVTQANARRRVSARMREFEATQKN